MRLALFLAFTAIFAASAVARHLPPEVFTKNRRHDPGVKLLLHAEAETPPPSAPETVLEDDEIDDEYNNTPLANSASDELWHKHMRKGNSLNCGLRGTDIGAGWQIEDERTPPSAASRWTGGIPQLVDWYWFEAAFDSRLCEMDVYWGLGNTFRELGISPRSVTLGGDLQCVQLRHTNENAKYPDGTPKEALAQSYVAGGKMYHATDASHFFSMNIKSGAIIGIALLGPNIAAERIWGWKPTPDQLPELRRLSDIYWAYWSSLHAAAGTRVDNINKYVVYSIQNPETDQIIARALRSVGKEELEAWPGQYFAIESQSGLALLGSPIGATIGYLLMQHKKELGDKYVTGARILRNDEQADDTIQEADLVFYITDVTPKQSIEDISDQDSLPDKAKDGGRVTADLAGLNIRDTGRPMIEERMLGTNNLLRVHTVMASRYLKQAR